MKHVTHRGPPSPRYREMTIESHAIPFGREDVFLNRLRTNHPDASLIMFGLDQLAREGSHLMGDALPVLPSPFDEVDLSRQARQVLWLRLRSQNGKEHLAGLLEWRAISQDDVVLTGLYVGKQFRRRGLGTALVHEAVRQMKSAGYCSALAIVSGRSWIAGHFLASCDFHLVLRNEEDSQNLRIHDLEAPRCFYRLLRQEVLFSDNHTT